MSCHDVSSPNYNLIEVISSARDFSLKIIKIKEIHLKEGDVIYWNLIFSFPFWRNYWNLKLTFRSSIVVGAFSDRIGLPLAVTGWAASCDGGP